MNTKAEVSPNEAFTKELRKGLFLFGAQMLAIYFALPHTIKWGQDILMFFIE